MRKNENKLPYNPHCTIKAGQLTEEDAVFEKMEFPKVANIEFFSLYQPWPNGGQRIHKFEPVRAGNA